MKLYITPFFRIDDYIIIIKSMMDIILVHEFIFEETWSLAFYITQILWYIKELRNGKFDAKKKEQDSEAIFSPNVQLFCRSDLSLVCSPKELEILDTAYQIPVSKLQLAPFFVHKEKSADWPALQDRKHFVTIGNFK